MPPSTMTDRPILDTHLYQTLHRLAAAQLRDERQAHTLQPTALVHEAWIRMVDDRQLDPAGREREGYASLASRVMRNVLVDHARARLAKKRGGGWRRVTLSGESVDGPDQAIDVLALDEALRELTSLDPAMTELIELRFFGGLTETEAAEHLGYSRSEATRRWRAARAWLGHRLRDAGEAEE